MPLCASVMFVGLLGLEFAVTKDTDEEAEDVEFDEIADEYCTDSDEELLVKVALWDDWIMESVVE